MLYLRNKNTGEIHRIYVDSSGRYSREICNWDDMKEAEEVTEGQYDQAGDKKCAHCAENGEQDVTT